MTGRALERTLAWRMVLVLVVGLLALSTALVWTLAWHLRAAADDSIDSAADVVRTAQQQSREPVTVNEARLSRLLPSATLIAVIADDGSVQVLSPRAVDVDALPVTHRGGEHFGFTVGDQRFRGVIVEAPSLAIRADAEAPAIQARSLLIAFDVTSDRRTVRAVALAATALTLASAIALAATARGLIRRSLSPLREIATAAGRIAATGAAEPMPRDTAFVETEAIARSVDDALARRERAERAMRDFVADSSHELRTPIAKIQGWADVAASGSLDGEEGRAAVGRIVSAAEELTAIVDELATLATLDAAPPRTTGTVDVAELAREVVSEAALVAEGARLAVDAPDPAFVDADRTALTRALRNLVGNAVQHGGGVATVTVRATASSVSVRVSDEGPGIAPEARSRVFDRFYTTAAGQGRHSGLGLAIVAAVARAHGGDVEVLDEGPGASLELTLPTSKANRQEGASGTSG